MGRHANKEIELLRAPIKLQLCFNQSLMCVCVCHNLRGPGIHYTHHVPPPELQAKRSEMLEHARV